MPSRVDLNIRLSSSPTDLPTTILSPFQSFKEKWKDGCGSEMCGGRNRVVLCRGEIPCDILFIGEAPGDSENVLGRPFVGPAGKLLDGIIKSAIGHKTSLRLAFTNTVGCLPRDEDGHKAGEPDDKQVKCCTPRLKEFVRLCKPRMIILVGAVAKYVVSGWGMFAPIDWLNNPEDLVFADITHPAAILKANVAQRGLMRQRSVVTLANAVDDYFN